MLGVMIGTTLMQGLPILGMPKEDEVVGAILEIDGKVQEISQEDLGLSVLIARGLRWLGACFGATASRYHDNLSDEGRQQHRCRSR